MWTVGSIRPNHGKALVSATFEGVEWIAQISVWETGETDVVTVRLRDQQVVNKHYKPASVVDLNASIDEVLRLLRDDETPPGAVIP